MTSFHSWNPLKANLDDLVYYGPFLSPKRSIDFFAVCINRIPVLTALSTPYNTSVFSSFSSSYSLEPFRAVKPRTTNAINNTYYIKHNSMLLLHIILFQWSMILSNKQMVLPSTVLLAVHITVIFVAKDQSPMLLYKITMQVNCSE
jgi:hypothetical protein